MVTQNSNSRALTRRHTITVCDTDDAHRKVQPTTRMESVINEEEEKETFVRGHATRRPTRLVSYRQHANKLHENVGVHSDVHRVHGVDVSRSDSPKMHGVHADVHRVHGPDVSRSDSPKLHVSAPPTRRHSDIFISKPNRVHEPYFDSRNSVCASNSVVNPTRSVSPDRHVPRPTSPRKHAGRAQSPVRSLSRSETFTTSIPHNSRNCVRNETFITARCDSPQTRQMTRSESFPARLCKYPSKPVRSESPCRHSSVHSQRNNACDDLSLHDRALSPCRKVACSERPMSPCSRTSGTRSRSQSPCRRVSQTDSAHSVNHSSNKAVPALRHSRSIQRKSKTPEPENNNVSNVKRSESVKEREKPIPAPRRTIQAAVNKNQSHIQVKDNVSNDNKADSNKIVAASRQSHDLSLQDGRSEPAGKEQEVTLRDKVSHRQRPAIIRARSKPEIRPTDLVVKSDNFESENRNAIRERPVSEIDFRRVSRSHIPRPLSVRSNSERQLVHTSIDETNESEVLKRLAAKEDSKSDLEIKHSSDSSVTKAPGFAALESKAKRKVISDPKEDQHWGIIETKPKREIKLSRQSAIRSERKEVSKLSSNETTVNSRKDKQVVEKNTGGEQIEKKTRQRVAFNDTELRQSIDETDQSSASIRPGRIIARSRSEVRPRSENVEGYMDQQRQLEHVGSRLRPRSEMRSRSENRPVKGLHYLDRTNSAENLNESAEFGRDRSAMSPVHSTGEDNLVNGEEDGAIGESSSPFGGLASAIKGLSKLNVTDMLHVSWKSDCPRKETNNSSPCSDCRPIPVSILTYTSR